MNYNIGQATILQCPEEQAGAGGQQTRHITQWTSDKEGEMDWPPFCGHFSPT